MQWAIFTLFIFSLADSQIVHNDTIASIFNDDSNVTKSSETFPVETFTQGVIQDVDDLELNSIDNVQWAQRNESTQNATWDGEWNDFSNMTSLPSVADPEGTEGTGPAVGTAGSAVILAAVFVLLAAVAYGGMLAWRRYLHVQYGNSAMLITDDVYDITDLRNFEI